MSFRVPNRAVWVRNYPSQRGTRDSWLRSLFSRNSSPVIDQDYRSFVRMTNTIAVKAFPVPTLRGPTRIPQHPRAVGAQKSSRTNYKASVRSVNRSLSILELRRAIEFSSTIDPRPSDCDAGESSGSASLREFCKTRARDRARQNTWSGVLYTSVRNTRGASYNELRERRSRCGGG